MKTENNILEKIDQLGDNEILFLFKCAQSYSFSPESIASKIHVELSNIDLQNLYDKKYLIPSQYWFSTTFNSIYYVPVIITGLKRFPGKMKEFAPLKEGTALCLWKYVSNILSGKVRQYSESEWPMLEWDTSYNFMSIVNLPEYRNLITCLPIRHFCTTIRDVLFRASWINEDYSSFDYAWLMELVKDAKKKVKKPVDRLLDIEDHINLTNYFLTGERQKFTGPRAREYDLALDAIRTLYGRDYTGAYALFQAALKEHNAQSDDKNYFYVPQLNFFLTLGYAMVDSEESRKKVSQMVKKKQVKERPEFRPSVIVAEFICMNRRIEELNSYNVYFRDDSNFSNLKMYYLLLTRYFNTNLSTLCLDKGIEKRVPRDLFLRHELSGLIDSIGKEEKARLEKMAGGAPLLASKGRKSEWEKALDEIMDLLPKDNGTRTDEKRLAYYFSRDHVDIREQKRMANGEWKRGALVSTSSFRNGNKVVTDETDLLIKNEFMCNYFPTPRDIVPYLIGSDRVFRNGESYYDEAKPVKIREEKVYLSVKKNRDGKYTVSTNVPGVVKIEPSMVHMVSETEYVVFKLTQIEQAILGKVRKLGEIPEEAEKMLAQLLLRMGKSIEIHSPLVEGTEIEVIKSTPIISLLIRPKGLLYELQAVVQPIQDGKLELIPGKGNETVYDIAKGKRFEIKRDIKLELQNFDELTEFMYTNFDGIEEMDEENGWIVAPQNFLDLMSFVRDNEDRYNIKWPEGKGVRIRTKVSSSNVSATLKHKENWFEMEGTVSIGEGSNITIKELLALLEESGGNRFVKLSDDEYIELEDSLRKQLKQLEDIAHLAKRIPMYQIGSLADMVYGDKAFIKTDKAFKNLEKKMEDAASLSPEVPKLLNGDLREYQYNGFVWMVRLASWGAGACLADEMGLGKTIQTIALMLHRKGPHLVVAPTSVVFNWVRELEKFAPSLHVSVLNDTSESRESVISEAAEGDVVLCSYGILQREEELVSSKKWDTVCLDEAHTIKNHGTKTSMAAMKLQAECRIALTGTPIQNNLAELWNIFQFINPGILGSHESFLRKFGTGSEIKGNGKRLKSLIQPFILRRRKSDVAEELPDKVDSQRLIDLTKEETIVYETVRETTARQLENANKVDVNILAQITKLRQAACSIGLIEKKWNKGSSKEESAIELISQIVESGNRVLVFSQFTRFLTSVQSRLAETNPEIVSLYLDGSTPAKKREELVNSFQKGEGSVFFVSLKAGGLGLNLTGANYVIHLDPWWNPAIESQATDRAHRIGQKRNVTVYHLISSHTIEEKILRLHKTKKDLADYLMEGTDVGQSITMDDLRNLVTDNE